MTATPVAPQMVRMSAFMLTATPVCEAATAATTNTESAETPVRRLVLYHLFGGRAVAVDDVRATRHQFDRRSATIANGLPQGLASSDHEGRSAPSAT